MDGRWGYKSWLLTFDEINYFMSGSFLCWYRRDVTEFEFFFAVVRRVVVSVAASKMVGWLVEYKFFFFNSCPPFNRLQDHVASSLFRRLCLDIFFMVIRAWKKSRMFYRFFLDWFEFVGWVYRTSKKPNAYVFGWYCFDLGFVDYLLSMTMTAMTTWAVVMEKTTLWRRWWWRKDDDDNDEGDVGSGLTTTARIFTGNSILLFLVGLGWVGRWAGCDVLWREAGIGGWVGMTMTKKRKMQRKKEKKKTPKTTSKTPYSRSVRHLVIRSVGRILFPPRPRPRPPLREQVI